ncbi:E3 ubiquitin-protein ligase RNF185 isoform X2 [Camelus dromedarius]|uniref:E3 ubiquitin-protein ligase RNF185 isoform X2 n=1 Tax=Camelus bactrianus TaxID=9837 RepID=A0AC58PS43_CAMBA
MRFLGRRGGRRVFLGKNLHSAFADSQEWRARGPRPLRPLRTLVQGGPVAAAMALERAEGRTAPSNATSAWTQPRTPSSACAATSSVGRVYISGWRPDLTDRCVQFAKPASAVTRSSRCTAGAAPGSRTPERRPHPVLKDRGQSQRTEGDFKGLDLEMVVSRCLLELEHSPLGYLPQHLT